MVDSRNAFFYIFFSTEYPMSLTKQSIKDIQQVSVLFPCTKLLRRSIYRLKFIYDQEF